MSTGSEPLAHRASAGFRGRTARLGLAATIAGSACAQPEVAYLHNRTDYHTFRRGAPELLEPNYLPFMTWSVELRAPGLAGRLPTWLGGREPDPLLVFCHWEPDDLPLAVWIGKPELPPEEDALRPTPPEAYPQAVEQALAVWERDLDGVVRFERVEDRDDAILRIRLLGEAPVGEDVLVLGSARIGGGCRVRGRAGDGRLDVDFRVSELRIHLADDHGRLLPDQVEKVALHEIGHALGMPSHSPVPADLMYPVARDRIARDGLGTQDVHSFLSLYAIPSGTVYRAGRTPAPERAEGPMAGPPRLSLAPHVDPRLGFEVQPPEDWTRIPTSTGLVVVDGVSWDYETSLQVIVRRFDSIGDYLDRAARSHLRDSRIRSAKRVSVAGRPARHLVLETRRGTVEELTFIESGDGRVLVVIAEAPAHTHEAWSPWLAATVESLEITDQSGMRENRDYRSAPGTP